MPPVISVLMLANMDTTVLQKICAILNKLMNKFTIMGSKI